MFDEKLQRRLNMIASDIVDSNENVYDCLILTRNIHINHTTDVVFESIDACTGYKANDYESQDDLYFYHYEHFRKITAEFLELKIALLESVVADLQNARVSIKH